MKIVDSIDKMIFKTELKMLYSENRKATTEDKNLSYIEEMETFCENIWSFPKRLW